MNARSRWFFARNTSVDRMRTWFYQLSPFFHLLLLQLYHHHKVIDQDKIVTFLSSFLQLWKNDAVSRRANSFDHHHRIISICGTILRRKKKLYAKKTKNHTKKTYINIIITSFWMKKQPSQFWIKLPQKNHYKKSLILTSKMTKNARFHARKWAKLSICFSKMTNLLT